MMALAVFGCVLLGSIMVVFWREARHERRMNRIRAMAANDPDLLLVPRRVARVAYDRAMKTVRYDKNQYEGFRRAAIAEQDERTLQLLERILRG